MAPGSRKAQGGFWLPAPTTDLDAVLLVESAVDALSALLLLAPTLPSDTLVASTAGLASALPRWLQAFPAPRILCAYDADPAGDQAAAALQRHTPHCRRLRPAGAKDRLERSAAPSPPALALPAHPQRRHLRHSSTLPHHAPSLCYWKPSAALSTPTSRTAHTSSNSFLQ